MRDRAGGVERHGIPTEPAAPHIVELDGACTLKDLAWRMRTKPHLLIASLEDLGEAGATRETELDYDVCELLVEIHGMVVVDERGESEKLEALGADIMGTAGDGGLGQVPQRDAMELMEAPPRHPVVTVMGHVDHGKTTLLDYLRSTSVASGEAGGITQSIGAFSVGLAGLSDVSRATFIDTPGHEAFTTMRQCGTKVTDIVVLVVDAVDGCMPQTIESVEISRACDVTVIVAVTKCDKLDAETLAGRVAAISAELLMHGLTTEDQGGDTQVVEVSAATGAGVTELLEAIALQTSVMETLRAETRDAAEATILESSSAKGLGSVADVLVQWGTLSVGDYIVAGAHRGRVKGLIDDRGKRVKTAGPSTPVRVVGLGSLPEAGAALLAVESDAKAKELVADHERTSYNLRLRTAARENAMRETAAMALRAAAGGGGEGEAGGVGDGGDEFGGMGSVELPGAGNQPKQAVFEPLKLVVKADMAGSLEALQNAVLSLQERADKILVGDGVVAPDALVPVCSVQIVRSSVGPITSADVKLAAACGGAVVGFNVSTPNPVKKEAKQQNVSVSTEKVIYHLIDDVKAKINALLPSMKKEEPRGQGKIAQVFDITGQSGKLERVAGCQVHQGTWRANHLYRVLRRGEVVNAGARITEMRHHKETVNSIDQGQECGLFLDWDGFESGDELQVSLCWVLVWSRWVRAPWERTRENDRERERGGGSQSRSSLFGR